MNHQLLIEKLYPTVLKSMLLASQAIMEVYESEISTQVKNDGSPVTQADLASSKILIQELSSIGYPILDEESKKAEFDERKNWEYFWCIDPLDGTKEFISRNGEFAINIALIHKNQPIFGAICSPITKEVILGGENFGAFFANLENPEKLFPIPEATRNESVTLIISRSHFTGFAQDFMNELTEKFGEIAFFEKGSALKFFDLANGNADVYARFGPTMEWDIAAGHAILRELGGEIYQYNSEETLQYNKESLFNPQFVAYTAPMFI